MIKVSEEDLKINHQIYVNAYKTSTGAAFLEDKFIEKSFPKLEKLYNRQYPYDVKLPKPMAQLAKGDFSPARIIRITEPIKGLYSNIWFGDSSDGVALRCGYKDGDSRYVCEQKLDDGDVHMVMGGSTGQGKSVTLNSIIFGFCLEYAPWEVALTLCDAKIVEFKSYALQTPMPHIRNIAATGDVDYLISVLQHLNAEMTQLNNVFTKAGIKNIKDFRKQTGLSFPQNIIVIDEFQSMFKFAGKKAPEVEKLLDSFARLGRNTGYHLLLASQEIGSEISQNTLGNIKVRAAVGCTENVSNKVLGNDAAKNNYGKKGRLIINASGDHQKTDNQLVRVPYMPDEQRIALGESVIAAGNLLNYQSNLSFYDEQDKTEEQDYVEFLKRYELQNNSIILGEPSFVTEETEKVVRLKFNRKDIENICVLTIGNNNFRRYFKMLQKNMEIHTDDAVHLVVAAETVFSEEFGARELTTPAFFTDSKVYENNIMSIALTMVSRRKLCLEIDKNIFEMGAEVSIDDSHFYSKFDKGSEFDTLLNKKRFGLAASLLRNRPDFVEAFNIANYSGDDLDNYLLKQSQIAVETFKTYNSTDVKLEVDAMPPIYTWLLGVNKIMGLGRDCKSKYVTKLKKALQDCTEVNMRFILFTTTMEDVEELLSGIRWFLLDSIPTKEISKIKATDFYPEQISGISCVLYDTIASTDKCVKFKKMILDGEIIT